MLRYLLPPTVMLAAALGYHFWLGVMAPWRREMMISHTVRLCSLFTRALGLLLTGRRFYTVALNVMNGEQTAALSRDRRMEIASDSLVRVGAMQAEDYNEFIETVERAVEKARLCGPPDFQNIKAVHRAIMEACEAEGLLEE